MPAAMSAVFKKLNLKDQTEIVVLGTMTRPASFALSAGGKTKSAASARAKPHQRQVAAKKKRPAAKRRRTSRP